MTSKTKPYSPKLQQKIDFLKSRMTKIQLGKVHFGSPLLLAPMSSICNAPFRLLMEDLGSGGSVSELISCHGINYGNERTRKMLFIDPREQNVGIQLFGEDKKAMAEAAYVATESPGVKFIDINMGCPVRKVVTKGGGSALLQNTQKLGDFFCEIKKAISIPLTIKIRTGWDSDNLNAKEVVRIAHEEGIEFVAIHGRTRTQQYTGKSNWDFLEEVAQNSPLPIIGNGDLHSVPLVKERLKKTKCQALMLGRGPLRNPFLFLESLTNIEEDMIFTGEDYWEITQRLFEYSCDYIGDNQRTLLIQMRKHIVWFTTGFPGASDFRGRAFAANSLKDTMNLTQDYFLSLGHNKKQLKLEEPFMTSGHG